MAVVYLAPDGACWSVVGYQSTIAQEPAHREKSRCVMRFNLPRRIAGSETLYKAHGERLMESSRYEIGASRENNSVGRSRLEVACCCCDSGIVLIVGGIGPKGSEHPE
jgi:hypothetical protein